MTQFEALELSRKFPKNRSVVKPIYDALQKTRGSNRKKFEQIVEGLYVDAKEDEDFDILNKYFG